MTREQIEKKAVERFPHHSNDALHKHVTEWNRQAYIEGALMMMEAQWVSVEDRLPENSNRVVVYMQQGSGQYEHIETAMYMATYWSCSGNQNNITHWQPLPEPPKQTK